MEKQTTEMTVRKGVDCIGNTVVFFCHDGEGNFLLSKRGSNCRDEHGTWDPGSGGIEFGDTVDATIRKEIAEEYCTEVLDYDFLGYRDVHREHEGEPTHWIALDFMVHVDRTKTKNGEPHKLDEIGWFTLETLPQPLHSQFPSFLSQYRDRLLKIPASH